MTPPLVAPPRRVLFAVELIDPITRSRVTKGVRVTANGITAAPVVSLSGRFIWALRKSDLSNEPWPDWISVDPGTTPYIRERRPGPARPASIDSATAAERLLRIVLRPTRVYDADAGVSTARGALYENGQPNAVPVVGAVVQLAWYDPHHQAWSPTPAVPADPGDLSAATPIDPVTDRNGGFLAFLALTRGQRALADYDAAGRIRARLQFTRFGATPPTRRTTDAFPFVQDQTVTGRIEDGRPSSRAEYRIAWAELSTDLG